MSDPTPLQRETTAVRGELARIDAKCATLAGLTGAGTALLAAQLPGHEPTAVTAVFGTSAVLMAAASIVLLLGVLRPRLGGTGFCSWARMTPEEIRVALAPYGAVVTETEDLRVLSVIALGKNVWLQRAIGLVVAAIAILPFAPLLAVLI